MLKNIVLLVLISLVSISNASANEENNNVELNGYIKLIDGNGDDPGHCRNSWVEDDLVGNYNKYNIRGLTCSRVFGVLSTEDQPDTFTYDNGTERLNAFIYLSPEGEIYSKDTVSTIFGDKDDLYVLYLKKGLFKEVQAYYKEDLAQYNGGDFDISSYNLLELIRKFNLNDIGKVGKTKVEGRLINKTLNDKNIQILIVSGIEIGDKYFKINNNINEYTLNNNDLEKLEKVVIKLNKIIETKPSLKSKLIIRINKVIYKLDKSSKQYKYLEYILNNINKDELELKTDNLFKYIDNELK